MVVDVENLFMSVHKEEDTDTKQVYFYLFKVSSVTGKTDQHITESTFIKCLAQFNNMLNCPLAAEEMHPADEPASRRGVPRKSSLRKTQH